MNQSRVKAEFERKVVADLPQVVEKRVDEVIDWLVASDMRQWKAVSDRLALREAEHAERMLGRVQGAFESDRAAPPRDGEARGAAGGGDLRQGRRGAPAGGERARRGGQHRRSSRSARWAWARS